MSDQVAVPLAVDPRINLPKRARRPSKVSRSAKEAVLDGLRRGETLTYMLAMDDSLPSMAAIAAARRADPAFKKAFQEARDDGLELRIEECLDYGGSVRNDRKLSVAADRYANTVVRVAEKLSPDLFGKKSDGGGKGTGKVTINLVNFGNQDQATPLTTVDIEPLAIENKQG